MKKDFSRTASLLVAEIIAGAVLSLSSALVFVRLTSEVLEKELTTFDNLVSMFIYGLRSPGLTKVMLVITNLGASYSLGIAVVIIILLAWKRHRKEAYLFGVVLAMGLLINLLLKTIIQRPRPEIARLVGASLSSYPSGHEMNSFVFYAMVAFFVYHFTRKKTLSILTAGGCLILILLIGFSRIYLGVHYATDVIAGYFAGLAWFTTAMLIGKTVNFYELVKESRNRTAV